MNAATLTVENVTWSPRKGAQLLLHELSFEVPAGKILGIVGANGAGKTTLLRLIYGYNRPKTGHVSVNHIALDSLPAKIAARKVAAVLQEQPTDFALNVREIISLGRLPHREGFSGLGKADEELIDRAIERLNLQPFAHRSLATLSGGERQRVMVARALAQSPQILVLDEPTNHLDIRHQLEVLHLIKDLDMTIVTSLHDLNLASKVCDLMLILKSGRALGFGEPEEMLNNQIVAEAFHVDVQRERLQPSNLYHFSFTLPHTQETP